MKDPCKLLVMLTKLVAFAKPWPCPGDSSADDLQRTSLLVCCSQLAGEWRGKRPVTRSCPVGDSDGVDAETSSQYRVRGVAMRAISSVERGLGEVMRDRHRSSSWTLRHVRR